MVLAERSRQPEGGVVAGVPAGSSASDFCRRVLSFSKPRRRCEAGRFNRDRSSGDPGRTARSRYSLLSGRQCQCAGVKTGCFGWPCLSLTSFVSSSFQVP